MALAARDAMAKPRWQAHADLGHFKRPQNKACQEAGIQALVPKPMTSNAKAGGRYGKADFICIAGGDECPCPAGQIAIFRFTRVENGLTIRRYWNCACPECPMKCRCTPSDCRRISRWEHEHVLDALQRRLALEAIGAIDQRAEARTVIGRAVEQLASRVQTIGERLQQVRSALRAGRV